VAPPTPPEKPEKRLIRNSAGPQPRCLALNHNKKVFLLHQLAENKEGENNIIQNLYVRGRLVGRKV